MIFTMYKNFLITAVAVCLVSSSTAQVPREKTLLWQVSGKGITKPSYLFGTIHIMCENELVMPAAVKEKFGTATELYLEIDMDDPGMMKEMMTGMQMKDSSTLQQLIGDRFDSANMIFKKITGMPLTMMNKAKPFLLMSLIYPSLLGCMPASWESVFQKMAKEKTMEIKGLETLRDQMDVFEKIPYHVQSDMLTKLLFNIDSAKNDFNEMLDVYKQKDINKLNEITVADEDFGEYEGILLNDRNQKWIPVIGEQSKKMPTFFAFGAGHLGGKNGVIYLLRKAGFVVKPVFYE